MEPLLAVEGLAVEFRGRRRLVDWLERRPRPVARAVDGVDLSIDRHETVGLVGESGSGKTTLGRAILRLVQPSAGRVLFEGEDIAGADAKALRGLRRRLQMVFQNPHSSLNPRFTVAATIAEVLRFHRIVPENGIGAETARLLSLVGLGSEMAGRYPRALSGGQRQRVGLARALAVRPSMLVLDEPVAALDVSIQAQVLNLLNDLRGELGLTMLFIAHEMSVVRHMSRRVAVMYLGRIVETGTTDEIFTGPRHPYTQGLLGAVPRLEPVKRRRQAMLQGDIPSPYAIPAGCRFHTRCPRAEEICCRVAPPRVQVSETHSAECHFAG
jgi:oligopeptide/dipeptide ABC transporter ATP-binding protein